MRLLFICFIWLVACTESSNQVIPRPTSELSGRLLGEIGDSAMVVCAHPEAAKVGYDILKSGGNAIDAAIAVQFALAVVYPNAGNIGGGGFMVLRLSNGEMNSLDYREKAPSASSRDMFLDPASKEVDRNKIENSHLASGVPGSVDGMWTAHLKYGSLPWKDLIEPAITLAKKWISLTGNQAAELTAMQKELKKLNPGKNYFINEDGWKEGDTLIQSDLAGTLELIAQNGRNGFYRGAVAENIVAEMRSQNGIITMSDLDNYHSVWRQPLVGNYRGHEIISMPPPSSGGVALLQLLNMVENYPLTKTGFHSVNTIQLMTECEKRVYADRSTWLGDPDFVKVPVAELISKAYAKERIANIDTIHITASKDIAAGKFTGYESEETTHLSIVDQYGNAVAITTTLNDSYGSRLIVKGSGFFLNNEMDDFSAKPGEPNLYGLIGGTANAIEPNKRMLSSMTPTIVLDGNKLFMIVGSPGGSTIITSVFQNIVNVIDFNMTMKESVDAPRFHHQWLPDEIVVEKDFDPATVVTLTNRGYSIRYREAMGRVDAILIYENGKIEGAADKRGNDMAIGW